MKTASPAVSSLATPALNGNLSEDLSGVFVLKPMLQWGGKSNRKGRKQSLSLVWLSFAGRKRWSVSIWSRNRGEWLPLRVREVDSFAWEGAVCHRLEAMIEFESDADVAYRLESDGARAFESHAKFPIGASRQRVVLFGDFADGTAGAGNIAECALGLAPDMVLVSGDIVYKSGLLREYKMHYEPVFNGPSSGVPLARTTVVVAAAGNHDVRLPKDADKVKPVSDEDAFGFFRIFRQANNGPRLSASGLRDMVGENAEGLELLRCIGPDFVRRSNFALYQGNVQWTILDANKYMDWREPELQSGFGPRFREGETTSGASCRFTSPDLTGMRSIAAIGECVFWRRSSKSSAFRWCSVVTVIFTSGIDRSGIG
ncbi:metallophosphoesterase [Candidatus Obscuribacterales bacterium]|nr:metallophosphoesterase [Candidatus Obscuribacterales bacterium]